MTNDDRPTPPERIYARRINWRVPNVDAYSLAASEKPKKGYTPYVLDSPDDQLVRMSEVERAVKAARDEWGTEDGPDGVLAYLKDQRRSGAEGEETKRSLAEARQRLRDAGADRWDHQTLDPITDHDAGDEHR